MVIQHNIPAINSHRNLLINNNATAKNLEKLSSGYRINRAGDDAAGLAISEKMRGQIRGLAKAEDNASHAINLIQTAEGGLQETHAILQRMRELAVQASNGTYQNEDRANIALEVTALMSEVDRIATATEYNGMKLLDGSLGGEKSVKVLDTGGAANITVTAAQTGVTAAKGDYTGTLDIVVDSNGDVWANTNSQGYQKVIGGTVTDENGYEITLTNVNQGSVTGITYSYSWNGTATSADAIVLDRAVYGNGSNQVVFQIGANGTADQQVGLNVSNMSSANLGIAEISIATRGDANLAIDVIDAAIDQVSAQRADLGALQNRLEHTLNNLGVTKENLTAAESTIRDVDMAKEMMEFTKNSILVQASQAMLAQANALPQGVLSLLG